MFLVMFTENMSDKWGQFGVWEGTVAGITNTHVAAMADDSKRVAEPQTRIPPTHSPIDQSN